MSDDVIDLRSEEVRLTDEERALLHAIYVQDVISIPEIGRSLGWSDDGVHRLLRVLSNKLAAVDRPPLERTPAFGVKQVEAVTRALRSQLHAKRRSPA